MAFSRSATARRWTSAKATLPFTLGRQTALKAGAAAAFDPADREARRALIKSTGGGVFAACDFVGSEKSLAFATGALAKGGKVVVTGLLGCNFPLAATMFVLRAMASCAA
jgi:alcohol dehydrogenase